MLAEAGLSEQPDVVISLLLIGFFCIFTGIVFYLACQLAAQMISGSSDVTITNLLKLMALIAVFCSLLVIFEHLRNSAKNVEKVRAAGFLNAGRTKTGQVSFLALATSCT